jgi:hypothetical protein
VECDPTFNWRIREKTETPLPCPDSVLPEAKPPSDTALSGLIRTVYRLRSGLPPIENLERLRWGWRELFQTCGILSANGEGLWAIARGDYGQGKSHALQLFNELAINEGFAVLQSFGRWL